MSAARVRSALVLLLCVLVCAEGQAAPGRSDLRRLIALGAEMQVGVTLKYDARYARLPYPGGDVAPVTGVCADVVVRALRRIGVDLQVAVHEEMKKNFRAFPQLWGMRGPDPNIDHRRVPNLMTWFRRAGKALPRGAAYEPGDIVAWRLGNGLYHIGVVSTYRTPQGKPLVVHNIGSGARIDDMLGRYRELGHYRW